MKVKVIVIGCNLFERTPIESVGRLFKNKNDVFNIPTDIEDVTKSFQYFGNTPQNVYFINQDSEIKAGDYYISWGIFDKEYKISQSKKGEYPKCPHGKIIATTDRLGLPGIPRSFFLDFVEAKGLIDEVELWMTDDKLVFINEDVVVKNRPSNSFESTNIEISEELKDENLQSQEKMAIKVKLSAEEVLNAKFKNTLMKIEGYYKEAQGDVSVNQNYSASAVFGRIKYIKETFLADLKELAKEIEL